MSTGGSRSPGDCAENRAYPARMEAGTPPGASVGIQGRDGGLQRDSEAEPGEGLTDGGKEGGGGEEEVLGWCPGFWPK